MNLVERVKNILLQPKEEWAKIADEAVTAVTLCRLHYDSGGDRTRDAADRHRRVRLSRRTHTLCRCACCDVSHCLAGRCSRPDLRRAKELRSGIEAGRLLADGGMDRGHPAYYSVSGRAAGAGGCHLFL